jgi:hypothetical protein
LTIALARETIPAMRRLWWLVLLALGAVGCGGGSSSPASRLVGEWIAIDSTGTEAVGVTFESDNTYVAQTLALTSSTSALDEGESGVYAATASEITFTPRKSSCPGPDPIYSLSYSFSGSSLVVYTPSGGLSLEKNDSPGGGSASITFGCFQSDGSFVPSPFVAVSN